MVNTVGRHRPALGGAGRPAAPAELIRASGLVRKIGVLLNQAVAKLNATRQHPAELVPVTQACLRRVERPDAAAEQLRKTVRRHPDGIPSAVDGPPHLGRWSGTGRRRVAAPGGHRATKWRIFFFFG